MCRCCFSQIENKDEKIDCNHGVQNGIYCDCDEGWMSSGIHEEDPLTFHWCDTETVDRSRITGEPVKLSKPVEITFIIVSKPQCHNRNFKQEKMVES